MICIVRIVYQAQVVETGESVAIKKVFQDKRYKNRELQIMKDCVAYTIFSLDPSRTIYGGAQFVGGSRTYDENSTASQNDKGRMTAT